jgi:hypothetical protein
MLPNTSKRLRVNPSPFWEDIDDLVGPKYRNFVSCQLDENSFPLDCCLVRRVW